MCIDIELAVQKPLEEQFTNKGFRPYLQSYYTSWQTLYWTRWNKNQKKYLMGM